MLTSNFLYTLFKWRYKMNQISIQCRLAVFSQNKIWFYFLLLPVLLTLHINISYFICRTTGGYPNLPFQQIKCVTKRSSSFSPKGTFECVLDHLRNWNTSRIETRLIFWDFSLRFFIFFIRIHTLLRIAYPYRAMQFDHF